MKISLKRIFSKHSVVIILTLILIFTVINTYLIVESTNSSYRTNVVDYDYVLSQDGNNYKLKNMLSGTIRSQYNEASSFLNTALTEGKSVYINPGTYTLTNDIYIINKLNPKIIGNDATIIGNGYKIIIYGEDYTTSQYATISGLTLINTTIRVENSLGTTITNTKFINSSIGIEFVNTNTWSEYNKVENCQFINNTQGIAFRTPQLSNATGSYASSQIERCSFNIIDNSIGIIVEKNAQFSDSQLLNVRFWMGENGANTNQTALLADGSLDQTLLFGVVFESFTANPNNIFAIDLGRNCDPAPTIDSVSFLGNWTARVHNPHYIWLRSTNTIFQREVTLTPGVNGQYGNQKTIGAHPLTIASITPKISVTGHFNPNELVTVRIQAEYLDNILSKPVMKTFNSTGIMTLTDGDLSTLFPSQSVIWSLIIDAKTNTATSDVSVTMSCYGTTG